MRYIVAIFLALHGVVHALYFGQSQRLFELQEGMIWPDSSWAFSRLLGVQSIRLIASIACALAAIAFVLAGAALLFQQAWWRPVVVGAAAFSALLYILFWDGRLHQLDNQGGIGLFISLVILTALLVFRWPEFDF